MNTNTQTTPKEFLEIAKDLARENLFSSAQTWAGLAISFLENGQLNKQSMTMYSESLVLFADCLCQNQEYSRSLTYYEKALSSIPGFDAGKTNSDTFVCAVRFRYAQACFKAKDTFKAISLLEKIPLKSHTVSSLKLLARLLESNSEITKANQCYMELLRRQPHAIEAAEALIRNGVSYADLPQSCKSASVDTQMLLKAIHHEASCEYEKSNECLNQLEMSYPNNSDLMARRASNLFMNGDRQGAMYKFAKLRKREPDNLNHIEKYAILLQQESRPLNLMKLCEETFKSAPETCETWLCTALFCDMKGDREQALFHISKALDTNPRHVSGYQLKGLTLLKLGRPGEAVTAFRQAYRIRRDIVTYEGICQCYLSCNQLQEAFATANEAVTLFPKNPRALTLLGVVQTHLPNRHAEARKYLEKALALDSKCLEAVIGLANLHGQNQEYDQAVAVLEKATLLHESDILHTRLGEYYCLLEDFDRAMEHFTTALSINPLCEPAKNGSTELEKRLNGGDDLDEEGDDQEDDEEEDDDAEIDDMEADSVEDV